MTKKEKTAVIAGQLRTHAGNLDKALTTINNAVGASQHIKLGEDAYGLLCSWLPPILAGRHTEMDTLLSLAKSNLTTHAQNLRDAADDFSGTDKGNGDDVGNTGAPLKDVRGK